MAGLLPAVFVRVRARGITHEPRTGRSEAEDAEGPRAEGTPATAASYRQPDELVLPDPLLRVPGAGDWRGRLLRPVPTVAGLVGVVERAGVRAGGPVRRRRAAPALRPGSRGGASHPLRQPPTERVRLRLALPVPAVQQHPSLPPAAPRPSPVRQ